MTLTPACRSTALVLLSVVALLAGCAGPAPAPVPEGLGPTQARRAVTALLRDKTPDAQGWAADIHAALATLELPSTVHNLCAVMAVIEQESGYSADPAVPGLPAIAWKEIERRAGEAGVPMLMVRAALAIASTDGRSYAERIDAVKTERQLSEIFEDFIGRVPLGKRFLANSNPVRTGGPMQVSVAFAQAQAEARPYPYEVRDSIRHEVFTRRGGIYFGTAHLLAYEAPGYDATIYRFADFNAGRYASRNAAFQSALGVATGLPLALDGDLVSRGNPHGGETERAALTLAHRLRLSEGEVRRDLDKGDEAGFEKTTLYQRVFAYAEELDARKLPRAVLPRIELKSPKTTRKLTTQWFATRVDERYRRCVDRLAALATN